MNIVLFEVEEAARPLPLSDARAVHVLSVLRRRPGDSFDAGLIDGPRGKATLLDMDAEGLHLRFEWGEAPPPLHPVTLLVGMPRPQTARKVLEEATALGVEAMHFVATARGDTAYGHSRLWSSGEWRRHLVAGAAQAFTTRLPAVTWGSPLTGVLGALPVTTTRIALDNYESPGPLSRVALTPPVVLALGGERGWAAAEREALREAGFQFAHLGERVLRVETACVAALALVLAALDAL